MWDVIKERKLRFAGHGWKNKEGELISDALWKPSCGHDSIGHCLKTCLNQFTQDAGCNPTEGWHHEIKQFQGSSTQ